MAGEGKRYLIVGPSWVGDMIMSQTLYKLLRGRNPECSIDVLAPRASLPLVSRMAEIDRGIVMKTSHGELGLGYRRQLGEQLSKNRYNHAIVLPNSLKSALVPFFADIPVRTGFRGEYRYVLINDMRMLLRDKMPRMIDRFDALGLRNGAALPADDPAAMPELMIDRENLATFLERFDIDKERPTLGLCPGAEYGDAKRWPASHFATLAANAIDQDMQVIIFGGPNDAGIAGEIASSIESDRCFNLAGETSLLDAIDLLSHCRQVVTNDSGLMHAAAAVGVPVAVLYGSTSPAFTPPLSDKAEIFSKNLECSPCFKRDCPLGHKNCLEQLAPAELDGVIARASGVGAENS